MDHNILKQYGSTKLKDWLETQRSFYSDFQIMCAIRERCLEQLQLFEFKIMATKTTKKKVSALPESKVDEQEILTYPYKLVPIFEKASPEERVEMLDRTNKYRFIEFLIQGGLLRRIMELEKPLLDKAGIKEEEVKKLLEEVYKDNTAHEELLKNILENQTDYLGKFVNNFLQKEFHLAGKDYFDKYLAITVIDDNLDARIFT